MKVSDTEHRQCNDCKQDHDQIDRGQHRERESQTTGQKGMEEERGSAGLIDLQRVWLWLKDHFYAVSLYVGITHPHCQQAPCRPFVLDRIERKREVGYFPTRRSRCTFSVARAKR